MRRASQLGAATTAKNKAGRRNQPQPEAGDGTFLTSVEGTILGTSCAYILRVCSSHKLSIDLVCMEVSHVTV